MLFQTKLSLILFKDCFFTNVSSNQQDLQNLSDIECSRMALHFGPDFDLSSDQKDLQIKSRNKSC